jgi:chromosome segregation ATPase
LMNQLDEKDSAIRELRNVEPPADLQPQLDSLTRTLADKEVLIVNLEKKQIDLMKQLDEKEAWVVSLDQKVDSLQAQLIERQSRIGDLETQALNKQVEQDSRWQSEFTKVQNIIVEKDAIIQDLQVAQAELTQQLSVLKTRQSDLDTLGKSSRIVKLEAESDDLRKMIDEKNQQIKEFEVIPSSELQIDALNKTIAEKDAQIQKLIVQETGMQKRLVGLEAQIQDLANKPSETRNLLVEKDLPVQDISRSIREGGIPDIDSPLHESLQQDITEKNGRIADLQGNLVDLEARLANSLSQFAAEHVRNAELQSQLESLHQQVDSFSKQLEEKQSRISELETTVQEFGSLEHLDSLNEQIGVKQSRINELESDRQDVEALKEQIDSLTKQLEDKQSRINELESMPQEVDLLKEQAEKLNKQLEDQLFHISELETAVPEVGSLKEQLDSFTKQLEDKQSRISELERTLQEVDLLNEQAEELNKQLESKNSEIEQLELATSNNRDLQSKLESLQTQLEHISELQTIQSAQPDLHPQLEALEKTLAEKDDEISRLQRNFDTKCQELDGVGKMLDASNSQVKLLESQIQDIQAQVLVAQESQRELEVVRQESREAIQIKDTLQRTVSQLESSLQHANTEHEIVEEVLAKEKSQMEQELAAVKEQLEGVLKAKEQANLENSKLVESLQAQLARLEAELHDTATKLQMAKEQLMETEGKLSNANDAKTAMERSIVTDKHAFQQEREALQNSLTEAEAKCVQTLNLLNSNGSKVNAMQDELYTKQDAQTAKNLPHIDPSEKLQERMDSIEFEKASLKKIADLSDQLRLSHARLQELEDGIVTSVLGTRINELERQVSTLDKSLESSQQMTLDLQSRTEALKASLAESNSRYQDVVAAKESLREQLQLSNAQSSDLQRQLDATQLQLDQSLKQQQEHGHEKKELARRLSEVAILHEETHKEKETVASELKMVRQSSSQRLDTIEVLEAQRNLLQEQLRESHKAADGLLSQIEDLELQLRHLRGLVSALSHDKLALETRLKEMSGVDLPPRTPTASIEFQNLHHDGSRAVSPFLQISREPSPSRSLSIASRSSSPNRASLIVHLQQRINELVSELDAKDRQQADSHTFLEPLSQELEYFRGLNADLVARLDQTKLQTALQQQALDADEQHIASLDLMIQQRTRQVQELGNSLEEARAALLALNDHAEAGQVLAAEHDQLLTVLHDQTIHLEDANHLIDYLETELSALVDTSHAAAQKSPNYHQQWQQSQDKIENLEDQVHALQDLGQSKLREAEALRTNLRVLETSFASATTEYVALQAQHQESVALINGLREKLDKLERDRERVEESLQEKLKRSTAEARRVQMELESQTRDMAQLRIDNERLTCLDRANVDTVWQTERAMLQDRIALLEQDNHTMEMAMQDLKLELDAIRDDHVLVESAIDGHKQRSKQLERALESATASFSRAESEKVVLETTRRELDSLRGTVTSLEGQLDEKTKQVEFQLDENTKQADLHRAALLASQDERDELHRQARLHAKQANLANELEMEKSDLAKQVQSLTREKDSLIRQVAELAQDHLRVKETSNVLQIRLNQTVKDLDETLKQLDASKRNGVELNVEVQKLKSDVLLLNQANQQLQSRSAITELERPPSLQWTVPDFSSLLGRLNSEVAALHGLKTSFESLEGKEVIPLIESIQSILSSYTGLLQGFKNNAPDVDMAEKLLKMDLSQLLLEITSSKRILAQRVQMLQDRVSQVIQTTPIQPSPIQSFIANQPISEIDQKKIEELEQEKRKSVNVISHLMKKNIALTNELKRAKSNESDMGWKQWKEKLEAKQDDLDSTRQELLIAKDEVEDMKIQLREMRDIVKKELEVDVVVQAKGVFEKRLKGFKKDEEEVRVQANEIKTRLHEQIVDLETKLRYAEELMQDKEKRMGEKDVRISDLEKMVEKFAESEKKSKRGMSVILSPSKPRENRENGDLSLLKRLEEEKRERETLERLSESSKAQLQWLETTLVDTRKERDALQSEVVALRGLRADLAVSQHRNSESLIREREMRAQIQDLKSQIKKHQQITLGGSIARGDELKSRDEAIGRLEGQLEALQKEHAGCSQPQQDDRAVGRLEAQLEALQREHAGCSQPQQDDRAVGRLEAQLEALQREHAGCSQPQQDDRAVGRLEAQLEALQREHAGCSQPQQDDRAVGRLEAQLEALQKENARYAEEDAACGQSMYDLQQKSAEAELQWQQERNKFVKLLIGLWNDVVALIHDRLSSTKTTHEANAEFWNHLQELLRDYGVEISFITEYELRFDVDMSVLPALFREDVKYEGKTEEPMDISELNHSQPTSPEVDHPHLEHELHTIRAEASQSMAETAGVLSSHATWRSSGTVARAVGKFLKLGRRVNDVVNDVDEVLDSPTTLHRRLEQDLQQAATSRQEHEDLITNMK